jgi:subtilisin family serine protease
MGPDVFGGFASTHVIVRVKPGVKPVQRADGRWKFQPSAAAGDNAAERRAANQLSAALSAALTRRNVQSVRIAGVSKAANVALAKQIGLDRYYYIDVPAGSDVQQMAAELAAYTQFFDSVQVDGLGGIASLTPNDPFFSTQWNMHNTGQSGGVEDADVDAPEAWELFTGDTSVTLAIVDSGVQSTHDDLLGRVLPGWNTNENPPNANSEDIHGHGTHVAGIAAATGNNSYGVAGMNWGVNILPVRCVNSLGSGTETMCADAIMWATDNGADIISMSLQYYTGTQTLHDAVQYAYASGVLLIGASGNFQSAGTVAFPARFIECLGVAATNRSDGLYFGSNSGTEVDIAAPGQDVFSLWKDFGFNTMSGTSMATPHVSGLASLMMSINPELTREDIVDLIIATSVDKGDAGWDPQYGHGLINAAAALEAAIPEPLAGDVDLNGLVNIDDLLAVINSWGTCPIAAPCPADVALSGAVDIDDLLTVINNWTTSPEP